MSGVISEKEARAQVSGREWQKGQPYVRGLTGLTVRAVGDAQEYRALAYGQETYRVSVTVRNAQVVAYDCSCPVGAGCKHTAALLNRLSQDGVQAISLPALDDLLSELDSAELRRLITRMLNKAPELETLLYAQPGKNINVNELAPRIEAAFQTMSGNYNHYEQWDSEDGPDTEAIEALLDELEGRRARLPDLEQEEAEAIARAYIAVLDGVGSFYEEHDTDYGLDDVQMGGELGLFDLFVNADLEGDVREEALEALRNELVSGRPNTDRDEFYDFYSVLTATEQRGILELLESLGKKGPEYRRKHYLQVLLELRGGEPTEEETEALLRADHNPTALIGFLLERGRVQEALTATKGYHGRIPFGELEPAFRQANQVAELEKLALKQPQWSQQDALGWLYGHYLNTGRTEQAHQLAQQQAKVGPSTAWLERLKMLSPNWAEERDKIIKRFWKDANARNALIRLLVSEELPDQAYELAQLTPYAQQLVAVAEMPSLDDQRAALLLIRAAREEMSERIRPAYTAAAQTLRRLIERVGLEETRTLVAAQFPERQKLPALRDELQKAGLL